MHLGQLGPHVTVLVIREINEVPVLQILPRPGLLLLGDFLQARGEVKLERPLLLLGPVRALVRVSILILAGRGGDGCGLHDDLVDQLLVLLQVGSGRHDAGVLADLRQSLRSHRLHGATHERVAL